MGNRDTATAIPPIQGRAARMRIAVFDVESDAQAAAAWIDAALALPTRSRIAHRRATRAASQTERYTEPTRRSDGRYFILVPPHLTTPMAWDEENVDNSVIGAPEYYHESLREPAERRR